MNTPIKSLKFTRKLMERTKRAPSTGAFMSSPEAREHPFSLPKTQIWDQLPPRVAPRGRVCRKSPIHPPTAEKHLYCRQARWLTRVVKILLKIIVHRRGRTTSTKITKQLSDVGRQPQAAQITSMSKSWWEEEKYKSMIRCDPPPLGMGGRLQCEKVECVILVNSLCCLDNWSNLMRQTNQSAPGPPSRSVKTIPRPENLKIIWKSFSCNSSTQNQQCLSADTQTISSLIVSFCIKWWMSEL